MMLNEPIAYGRTAEVYAWQNGQVLKLFYDWVPEAQVDYEAAIARAVYNTGLPVPAAGDVIEAEGRRGLLYERVTGHTMLERLQSKPWRFIEYARQLAALQVATHNRSPVAELPAQHERIRTRLGQVGALAPQLREALIRSLSQLPTGVQLCHGDFHPGNVMLTDQKPVIIDWIDVTLGNPLADVARTSVLLLGEADGRAASLLQRLLIRRFHQIYLREYYRLRPGGQVEYRAWFPIVAAVRLSERIDEQQNWLVAQAEVGLDAY